MDERDSAAETIVETHVWYAAGVGLIPVPFIDMAAVTGVNLVMIKKLSATYGVEFKEDRVKAIIGAMAGGVSTGLLARSTAATTALRTIPLVGQVVASLRMSLYGSALTYAVGRVFVQHYAAGGTLLDFDPAKARAFFGEQLEKGKQLVKRKPAPSPATA